MLLEDIDAAFSGRDQSTKEGFRSAVTFSGLLNALDGIASAEERLVFMTTNHVDRLDQALIRPGRVDVKEYFGNATDYQIREMFLRFYGGKHDDAQQFVARVRARDQPISPAALQGLFVYDKDNSNVPSFDKITT